MKKQVYLLEESIALSREQLGAACAELAELCRMGLPVPSSFVITADACEDYSAQRETLSAELKKQVVHAVTVLEQRTGKKLGAAKDPLVLRVFPSSDTAFQQLTIPKLAAELSQLLDAVKALFHTWNIVRHRFCANSTADTGVAVCIQTMVHGDADDNSGSGIVFTRSPATGEKGFFGEYMSHAQPEELLKGSRLPETISRFARRQPHCYAQLCAIAEQLEAHFADGMDISFVIQTGKLYLLHAKPCKGTSEAAARIAAAMVEEGLLTAQQAVERLRKKHVDAALYTALTAQAMQDKTKAAIQSYGCPLCGYRYEADSLPDDFHCPICRTSASKFETSTAQTVHEKRKPTAENNRYHSGERIFFLSKLKETSK